MERKPQRLLFVCTANACRSPTFEKCLNGFEGVECKSAGTHGGNKLNKELLHWADRVVVMELLHWKCIEDVYPQYLEKVEITGIRDIYQKDNPELQAIATKWALDRGFCKKQERKVKRSGRKRGKLNDAEEQVTL